MSFDSPEVNQGWAIDEGFSYELWSDTDKTLALTYGAARNEAQFAASRVTRLLDADGVLLLEYDEVSAGTNPRQVLEDCEALFGG